MDPVSISFAPHHGWKSKNLNKIRLSHELLVNIRVSEPAFITYKIVPLKRDPCHLGSMITRTIREHDLCKLEFPTPSYLFILVSAISFQLFFAFRTSNNPGENELVKIFGSRDGYHGF
jgi:hypothetical protein